ncbi:hypothetical protein PCO31010_04913 [Pandoraea commovens]|uniref:Uncharacterized protein n=1 Tax=Pandoraea commovens TaxID=2508289 RepID=A0A5E4Z0R3_9BURK|nr:hypothetical protein PCO31010_04913 [Pandoraea commovens]
MRHMTAPWMMTLPGSSLLHRPHVVDPADTAMFGLGVTAYGALWNRISSCLDDGFSGVFHRLLLSKN